MRNYQIHVTISGARRCVFSGKTEQGYIYILINQPDAQNLLYNKFISCLYMFRAPCADHQEV